MAVGLSGLPKMNPVEGVSVGTTEAAIKYENRKDLVLFSICEGASVAASFTTNQYCAAPVTVSRKNINSDIARANGIRNLLINTGSANAGTGQKGAEQAKACCDMVASLFGDGRQASQVMPFSTGVIGELLPLNKIVAALPKAFSGLSEDGWADAAKGIMTTDTVPKGVSEVFEISGKKVTITGISKGSGMIKPNMATMLAFIATDANVSNELLQAFLSRAVDKSFNRVTVDGDTSTNDACVAIATAKSQLDEIVEGSSEAEAFYKEFEKVCIKLAQALVRDGEGATKFISINVAGARNREDADKVAYSIAHSLLVKTAFFASDPNWGRLLATIGRSGVEALDISKVSLALGKTALIENGEPAVGYTEEAGQAEMNSEEIDVNIKLGMGDVETTIWTCDLSYDYVKINAEYRS